MKTTAEIIWVEMKFPDSKPVLLGCCYRPPSAKKEYLDQIEEIMTLVSQEKEEKDVLLMGDFNLKWENTDDQNKINFMSNLGFKQIVEDYTRVIPEKNTKTIIDHIYTNIEDLEPDNIVTGCSDHFLITVEIGRNVSKWIQSHRSTLSDQNFLKEIEEAKRRGDFYNLNPKKAVDEFTEKLVEILNKCAPLSQARKNIYQLVRINNELRGLYKDRDDKKEENIRKYLQSVTTVKDTSKRKKRQGERTSEGDEAPLLTDLDRLKEVYECYLRESLPLHMISITPEGVVLEAEPLKVDLHQTKNGSSDSVPDSDGSQPNQITRPDEFNFEKITKKTVMKWLERVCDYVIKKIDPNEAKLIKSAAEHISDPICYILNKLITDFSEEESEKTFPDELKKIQTFRFSPDSFISSTQIRDVDRVPLLLSYILDGILYEQVKKFCKQHIPAALLEEIRPTQNVWLIASENKKKVGAVFLDLNSSFNTISLYLLINTLRTSGFTDSACDLIESYFSSRGLPSGSLLSQLLYKIFIHDLKVLTTRSAVVRGGHVEFSLKIETDTEH